MWPSSSRNHKLSAGVLEYQTRSKVWNIQGNPFQWHRGHQCHTHRTVPSSLLKNDPQNRAFFSCSMQGAMLCRWDFCIGHGKKYTTRNMIENIIKLYKEKLKETYKMSDIPHSWLRRFNIKKKKKIQHNKHASCHHWYSTAIQISMQTLFL